MNSYSPALTFVLSVVFAAIGFAQEGSDDSKKEPKPIAVPGVFESTQTEEITADTKQVASLTLKRIVPHGTPVRKGQAIIWFETDETDDKIAAAERELRLAELTQREFDLTSQQLAETRELDKLQAKRTWRNAKQDFDNFMKTDRDRQVASAEFGLKMTKASLENAMEELRQLEKMYKEDELTEESEEIVLKRARRAVESVRFRLLGTQIETKRTIGQSIPRSQEQQEDSLSRQQLAYDKAVRTIEIARQRREVEAAKEKVKLEKQREDLTKLREDRKRSAIQAPADGIIYHGEISRGKVAEKPSALKSGSTVTNKQVIATVVNPGTLRIRLSIPEKELNQVFVGAKATARPTAFPDRKLPASVTSLSYVPLSNGKFEGLMNVKLGDAKPTILPGMGCSVEFVPVKK